MSATERLSTALAGRYRIEKQLGQGGMATVYLAQDLKHDRKVAVKVLKPELAAVLGAERFVVEIKTTASLQHPHILPLFDSGTADGFLFYVMPYVEGETLRDKLRRETQFSVDEAVKIATEVADALDYAHRHGVIHRDIKPENILLHDGRPVVADFGIALAVSAAAGGRMTETGLSLGTPHYMSPEQATAEKEITGRSDTYSLASVLYEMLTGNPPHVGSSAQQIIMKIIAEPVEAVTKYRKAVPPNVAAAVGKALEKLPADRFENARAFADALNNTSFSLATVPGAAGVLAGGGVSRRVTALATACVVLAGAAVWGWLRPSALAPVIRYQLPLPALQSSVAELPVPTPAPDGSFLVFHGPKVGSRVGQQLWIKQRDRQSPTPIPGTADAESFALSPEGDAIVYALGPSLRTVPIVGGEPVTLVSGNVMGQMGVAWLDDGTIIFSQLTRSAPMLSQVSADGGTPTEAWRNDSAAAALPSPVMGTHAVLFGRCIGVQICDLWTVDTRSHEAHLLLPGVMWARHAVTGHIVYVQDNRLLAVQFDARRLAIRGQPVPLADSAGGVFPLALSRSGTLVMRVGAGSTGLNAYDMVWVDRSGRVSPIDTSWRFSVTASANNHGWALSPDGGRLAIGLQTDAGDDIWVKQLPRGPLSRITFDPAAETRPRWTPDGRAVTFLSSRAAAGVYQRRADGAGQDSLLLSGNVDEALRSPDGKWLVYRVGAVSSVRGGRDVRGVRAGDTSRVPVIATPFDEDAIALSPDSKWLAYQSDETGRTEVFVRSFPNTEAVKRQVSNGGGAAPLWSRDGRELFYVSAGKDMMSARVTAGATLSVAQPVALFHVPDELLTVEYDYYTPWDVASDGRFIMARVRRASESAASTVVVAENWFTELKARVRK